MLRKSAAVVGAGLLLVLAACSNSVPQSEVETTVEDTIQSEFGATVDVTCPGDLPAEIDATMDCTFSEEGYDTEGTLTLTVESVEDNEAFFNIEVTEEPS